MALIFGDGFDHYATGTGDILKKWTSSVSMASGISAGTGRRGGASLHVFGAVRYLTRAFSSSATWIVGVAVQLAVAPSSDASLLKWYDGTTEQMRLVFTSTGAISVKRGTTTLGTSSSGVITAGGYAYIGWRVTIDNAAGASEVRVNGVTVLTMSSVDTQASANASANTLYMGCIEGGAPTVDFCDVYVCDGNGSVNNDFLGDCRIDTLYANGAGTNSDFSSSAGGASSYTNVDDATLNTTDYNYSDALNAIDTYAMDNLSALGSSIFGLQICAAVAKDDSGSRSVGLVAKSSSTTDVGADSSLSTAYAYSLKIHETDPATSAAWTESGVNALEAGVKVTV